MRAHVIKDGKIVNTIIVDSLDAMPGLVAATSGGIGDIWDGEKPVAPPRWKTLAEAIAARGAEVDALRIAKTFSDASVEFPGGQAKEIQLRNEFDLSNLLSVAVAGLALIISGKPTDELVYRTKDNATMAVKASEFVSIGMAVMAQKQAIVSAAWAHKDAIRDLASIADVEAYDITKGWPA